MDTSHTRLNLSAIRRNRGLTLADIAERTRISVRYLSAIEAENFVALPGLIYSVSYIRQYASAIDYDPSAILSLYRETVDDSLVEDAFTAPAAVTSTPEPIWASVRRALATLFGGLLGDAR